MSVQIRKAGWWSLNPLPFTHTTADSETWKVYWRRSVRQHNPPEEKPSPTAPLHGSAWPLGWRWQDLYPAELQRGTFTLYLSLWRTLFYTLYVGLRHHHHPDPWPHPRVLSSPRLAGELTFEAIAWKCCLVAQSLVSAASPFSCSAVFAQVFEYCIAF